MISAIQSVLESTKDHLLNQRYVEELIKEFGLFRDSRQPYGGHYNSWMKSCEDDGGIWQIPSQLAQAVIWLSNKNIESYIDIGTFNGYTFSFITSYLSKFGLKRAGAFDLNHYFHTFKDVSKEIPVRMEYTYRKGPIERNGSVGWSDCIKGAKCDLVFIDGNHNYDAIERDYENVGKHARLCMFHDINDCYVGQECQAGGAVSFWNDIVMREFECVEFTSHPEGRSIMGIGIRTSSRKSGK